MNQWYPLFAILFSLKIGCKFNHTTDLNAKWGFCDCLFGYVKKRERECKEYGIIVKTNTTWAS